MATKPNFFLASVLLLALSLPQGTLAYKFAAMNNASATPGGRRLDNEIGVPYTVQTMSQTANFIWKTFQQKTAAERRQYPAAGDVINVIVQDLYGEALGLAGENGVDMSAKGIAGRAKFEFTSILNHEMTHVFQWMGEGMRDGLIEGMADYAVLKSPYVVAGYSQPGEGRRWDEGYGATSRFLEYYDGVRPGFTAELNKMMKKECKEEYFSELLGKSVDEVWTEYKAKYSQVPAAST